MTRRPSVSVVIPTFNEKENVGAILGLVRSALERAGYTSYELIVVDDSSDDYTWVEAARHGARVLVRKREGKRGTGLASAIRMGALAARGDYVVVIDADLQHPPEVIPRLLRALEEGYDIAVASRYTRGGGVEGWSRLRYAMSKAAVAVTRLIMPEVVGKTSDPMSGFFAFRLTPEVKDALLSMRPRGFKFLLDLLNFAAHKWDRGVRVSDVPYVFKRRERGESKLGARVILDFIVQVVLMSNMHRFALVGASGTAVNLGVMAAVLKFVGDEDIASLAGIEAGVLSNFVLNEKWTFKECVRGGSAWGRLAKYHLSSAAGMAVTYATMKLLTVLAGFNPLLGQFIGVIAGFTVNFILSRGKVWRCGWWARGS